MTFTFQTLRCFLATTALLVLVPCSARGEEIDYENDIAPILEERCWHCHGEDEQESGLRLDVRLSMLRGGDSGLAAIVPGAPEKSYLIELINHVDEDMAMPPDDEKMPVEEIALLTRWIKEGANWPGQMEDVVAEESDFWSFQPVVRPAVPSVNESAAVGSRPIDHAVSVDNSIDAFLLDRLAKEDLTFSAPADPRSLIRRASIVLTGIAPTPEDTDAFAEAFANDSVSAYAALVDRLLESPHFGERWAQHWLDVIRWAETNGSEANLYRKNAWIYRDYVVRAFNEDLPYDQFIREQISGDSMGVGEATGFLVAGPHVPAATVGREPTAIRQARADRLDEVLQTVGASMLGVTIGCARCHNHKFDPISIKDYYAMTGVFQDIEFGSRFPEFSPEHPRRKRGGEIWAEIAKQRNLLREKGGWEEDWGAFRELHFNPVTAKAIRVRFKMNDVGLDELEVFGPDQKDVNLARANRGTQVTGFPKAGFEDRNPIERLTDGEFGTMVWRGKTTKGSDEKPWVRLDFDKPHRISRMRMSNNREYFFDTDYLDMKAGVPRYEYDVDVLQEDETWRPWVGTWFVNKKLEKDFPERADVLASIQRLIESLAEEGPRPSFVGRFVEPVVTRIMLRGSPENARDEVMPAGPEIFGGDLGLTSEAPGAQRRAEFAKWVSSAENPLTARVMVNRIWHHVFGRGIVSTTADFGKAGAAPTHPELLDWLAAEFVQPKVTQFGVTGLKSKPWSMKSVIRLLVMSAAFQQSSASNPQGLAKDAGAELLWRYPPQRVEAEVIRDSILQASGSLDESIGGRSYRIHNEKKTYAQWEVIDNHGPQTWRRLLYQERMRRVDDGIFTAFDFPDCGQVRAKRPVSTTPLQALNLMNSDFVIEQSKLIAERASAIADGDEAKAIDECFRLVLCRVASEQEREDCLALARKTDLSLVCRALINSNEFAFLP